MNSPAVPPANTCYAKISVSFRCRDHHNSRTRYGNSEGEPSIWQPALYGRYVGLRLFVDEAGAGSGSPLGRISEEGCRVGCDQSLSRVYEPSLTMLALDRLVSLKGGLRRVVIRQLRTLGIVALSRDTMLRPAPGRRRRHQPQDSCLFVSFTHLNAFTIVPNVLV